MDIQNIVTEQDTETLDAEITAMTEAFTEEHYLNNDEAEHLEMIVAKSMVLGELYERAKWQAKSQAVPEGFVLVPHDQFESLSMFKDLYKRAIISARKRKDQLNWAHVAGLGVGSGRAVELCKMLNIDPYATNMHEVIKPQEQSHDMH